MRISQRKIRRKKRYNYLVRRTKRIQLSLRILSERRSRLNQKFLRLRYHKRKNERLENERLKWFSENQETLEAPRDFRLLSNTLECASFFKDLLDEKYAYSIPFEARKINISLKNIEYIDFASSLLLFAICEELASRNCYISGKVPIKNECQKFLIESSFYVNKYNNKGEKINLITNSSQIMIIEKGGDMITAENIYRFIDIMERTGFHLVGTSSVDYKLHISLLKEICGNSVEWGEVKNRKWFIGAKFEEGSVVFCALDLGVGILTSLERRLKNMACDLFQGRSDEEILCRVFDEYYGSKSKEPNRNQGLPFFKKLNSDNIIKDLQVVSNNVYICFDKNERVRIGSSRSLFTGTLYSWRVDAECIKI